MRRTLFLERVNKRGLGYEFDFFLTIGFTTLFFDIHLRSTSYVRGLKNSGQAVLVKLYMCYPSNVCPCLATGKFAAFKSHQSRVRTFRAFRYKCIVNIASDQNIVSFSTMLANSVHQKTKMTVQTGLPILSLGVHIIAQIKTERTCKIKDS
eukprot:Pompholyxophrys_punicea_v1_NODE_976_length_1078_cov_54.822092.p2 type:complete len:151 gc:universal NODE_976_length_1078_cov_54.822092:473-925(+)